MKNVINYILTFGAVGKTIGWVGPIHNFSWWGKILIMCWFLTVAIGACIVIGLLYDQINKIICRWTSKKNLVNSHS